MCRILAGLIISPINAKSFQTHPVTTESRQFTGAQLNATTNKKELMAIVKDSIQCVTLIQVGGTVSSIISISFRGYIILGFCSGLDFSIVTRSGLASLIIRIRIVTVPSLDWRACKDQCVREIPRSSEQGILGLPLTTLTWGNVKLDRLRRLSRSMMPRFGPHGIQ